MIRPLSALALLAGALTALGCPGAITPAEAAPVEEAPAPSPPSPQAALDALDPRTPVPLLPQMAWHQKQNMQDHLIAVQEIVNALATDDLSTVAKAASRIGLSDQMQQTCEHMGAGAAGFTERALTFHRQADEIAAAATRGDKQEALVALGRTLSTCTSCHATFRQEIVSEAEWGERTGASPPSAESMHEAHMHHGR